VESSVDLTYDIRNYLLRGRLSDFGAALNDAWQFKRQYSSKITNNHIDSIYEGAINNGAIGGKILGAGAGGFFIFYAAPFRKNALINYLKGQGIRIHPFKFESEGLRAWSVRELKE
jgi:D-glycero-alpha-D-manno-heptose-7-phosphate kinase